MADCALVTFARPALPPKGWHCAGKIPACGFQGIKIQAPIAEREKASRVMCFLMGFSSLESKSILTLVDPQWMLNMEASGVCSLLQAPGDPEALTLPWAAPGGGFACVLSHCPPDLWLTQQGKAASPLPARLLFFEASGSCL